MIKLGLYGSGNRTRALLDALWKDEFYKVQAVYDLNQESAGKLTEIYGGTVCSSPEELVSFEGVDAFLISLSPFAHAEALRQTIPAGKPIFVEKPVSFSAAELRELADLADRYHVDVQVGFMRRYLPQTIDALKYFNENDHGRVFSVDCNWFHHGDTEMNFCLCHQPDNFRLKVSQIPFHCCHMLDIMTLFGGDVKRVSTLLTKVTERPYPSPDDVLANIEFTSGFHGHFHYSSMVFYTEMSYRIHTEKYSLCIDAGGTPLAIYRKPRFLTSQLGPRPELEKDFNMFNRSYEAQCTPSRTTYGETHSCASENIMYSFVRMVRDGVKPEASLRQAVRVQGLAEAIELSGKLQCPVDLDADGVPVIPVK